MILQTVQTGSGSQAQEKNLEGTFASNICIVGDGAEAIALAGLVSSNVAGQDSVAYIRLLGDRYAIEKITTTWGEQVIDRKPDLARWAPVMKSILSQRLNVFGYINSHYSGYAPGDVDTLYEMLGVEK